MANSGGIPYIYFSVLTLGMGDKLGKNTPLVLILGTLILVSLLLKQAVVLSFSRSSNRSKRAIYEASNSSLSTLFLGTAVEGAFCDLLTVGITSTRLSFNL